MGIALLTVRGDLPTLAERSLSLLAFGDVALDNQITPLPQLTATATGAANIRSTPRSDADILDQVAVTNGLILNGRTDDSRWLRVQVRNTDDYGWVSADLLNIRGNVNNLSVVDEHAIVQRPFEVMTLTINDDEFLRWGVGGRPVDPDSQRGRFGHRDHQRRGVLAGRNRLHHRRRCTGILCVAGSRAARRHLCACRGIGHTGRGRHPLRCR